MRKALSLFCLAIILLNFAGFYIFFFLQISLNRQVMREQLKLLPSEKLERILMNSEEFEKSRVDEHEVNVDGRMYDIARVQIQGDSVIVYGLHDAREDSLLTFISFIINEPINKKEMKLITQFLSLVYLPPNIPHYFSPVLKHEQNTRYTNVYLDIVIQEFFTPPRS